MEGEALLHPLELHPVELRCHFHYPDFSSLLPEGTSSLRSLPVTSTHKWLEKHFSGSLLLDGQQQQPPQYVSLQAWDKVPAGAIVNYWSRILSNPCRNAFSSTGLWKYASKCVFSRLSDRKVLIITHQTFSPAYLGVTLITRSLRISSCTAAPPPAFDGRFGPQSPPRYQLQTLACGADVQACSLLLTSMFRPLTFQGDECCLISISLNSDFSLHSTPLYR